MDPTPLFQFFRVYPGLEQAYRSYESCLIATKKRKNQKTFLSLCAEEQVSPKSFGFQKFNNVLGQCFPNFVSAFLKHSIKGTSLECEKEFLKLRRTSRDLRLMCPSNEMYERLTQIAHRKANFVKIQQKMSQTKIGRTQQQLME